MELLSIIISVVGLYLIGYNNHIQECNRHMKHLEEDAMEEDFHRTEHKIQELHKQGHVFNEEHIK